MGISAQINKKEHLGTGDHESGAHYKKDLGKIGIETQSLSKLAEKLGVNDEPSKVIKNKKKLNIDDK